VTLPFETNLPEKPPPGSSPPEASPSDSSSWNRTLILSISGLRFELQGLPSELRSRLAVRFSRFVVEPDSVTRANLTIRVRPAVVRGYLDYDTHGQAKVYELETRVEEGRLHAWSYAFSGWFEIDGDQGELSLCDSDVEPPSHSIENFLRVAFAWKASKAGGFLFHASGLVRDGRAYVFFGPSGSGKTTVTRLYPHELQLNDDCIHITRAGSVFYAGGVPFKGCPEGGAQDAGAFPIAGLFRLVQSRNVACERLGAAEAMAEIATSVPFVSETPEGALRVFEAAEAMARTVPVMKLYFELAPSFWDVMEESLRG
jgi:hypothetical protein